jgi:phosphoribosyl-AMP cyclohydrolase
MHLEFRYNADGLIPVIVQEAAQPKRVLMMAWMNRETIARTLKTGLMHYWSRSRQTAWQKGETSGHTQRVHRWFVDCDSDTLLFEVEQVAGACHTGYRTCFFRELDSQGEAKPLHEAKVFDPAEVYER